MITVNLKEIFAVDSQTDLTSKLNFNFNQLLSLGFGQTGPAGPIGPSGPAGPIGPIGETGIAGSQIYSGSTDPTSSDPIDAIAGDYYISNEKILKKVVGPSGSEWNTVSNFNTIFQNVVSVGTSTWQLGSISGAPFAESKYLTPIKSYGNLDRVGVPGTSGNWETNNPNWYQVGAQTTNSQVTVYNFDPFSTKIYTNESGGINNYGVTIKNDRIGEGGSQGGETSFPYTALLSLYSFYNALSATSEADQFSSINGSAQGSRHQIELGSVDELAETIVTSDSTAKYVISPTWQNLRIRKYRIPASSAPGGAIVHTDFNLDSPDTGVAPALNSKFTWRINKKTQAAQGNNTKIQLSLSNSIIEQNVSSQLTGLQVDGFHLKSGNSYKFAIGFDPNNAGSVKNLIVDSGATLDTVVFRNMGINLINTTTSSTSSLTPTGFTTNRSLTLATTGSQANVTINAGQTGRSVFILAPNSLGSVFIGSSTSNITNDKWSDTSGYAIKTRGNRLASGIPFPVSQLTTPKASSEDGNVLDEYLELNFTPTVSFDTTLPFTAPVASIQNSGTGPTFGDANGRFIKIGKLVHFDVTFSITNWQAKRPGWADQRPSVRTGIASRDTNLLNYGNISTSATVNPFNNLSLGAEPNHLHIRGLPNHYPALFNSQGATNFKVKLTTSDPGAPVLRGNPFFYSWGGSNLNGTSTSGTAGSVSAIWLALDPASVYGELTTYLPSNSTTTLPQIELFGHRRIHYTGSGTSLGFTSTSQTPNQAVSPVRSKVTIWDFLTQYPGITFYVTISGSYITDHVSANTANPVVPIDPGAPVTLPDDGGITNTG